MSIPPDAAGGTFRQRFKAPYSSRHPVPDIQDYEETLQNRQKDTTHESPEDSETRNADMVLDVGGAAQDHLRGHDDEAGHQSTGQHPYWSQNRNIEATNQDRRGRIPPSWARSCEIAPQFSHGHQSNETVRDDPDDLPVDENRGQRKHSAHPSHQDQQCREVTDPVTHIPILVHDWTSAQLESMPENQVPAKCTPCNEDGHRRSQEAEQQQVAQRRMKLLFPPPSMQTTGQELSSILKTALTAGLIFLLGTSTLLLIASHLYLAHMQIQRDPEQRWGWTYSLLVPTTLLLINGLLGILLVSGMRSWVEKKTLATWEDGLWDAARTHEEDNSATSVPESVQWLNSLLISVWPIVNPDLFTSLVDTLEDVMQASLPKFVRMISVDDLGQGNEAIRILGIKWLPRGNAQKDVSTNGNVRDGSVVTELKSDTLRSQEEAKDGNGTDRDREGSTPEGFEAEEGDFVNVEVGFSYRASAVGKSIRVKAKNAHLYLVFYLPGGIQFPVWVELRGLVGSMRMRLQLCPDPPFVARCTLTLLGQPKAELSCVPLTRKGLNIMNLPVISSFVQSSIDAALAEYVAPKSLTLDLKDMLIGDDFKKNTSAHGVLFVKIISATGFKEGDHGIAGLGKGSSERFHPCFALGYTHASIAGNGTPLLFEDVVLRRFRGCYFDVQALIEYAVGDGYVTVGWAKFGKPLWSTRIIKDDMEPAWEETAFLLIGPNESNAGDRLRVQLWDSDRHSADDDLGRVEVHLKELMSDPSFFGQISDRSDELRALSPNERMPGLLSWSVGYFPKTQIQKAQFEQQSVEPDIKSMQQLKDAVARDVYRKMREASSPCETPDLRQQMTQNLKTREGLLPLLVFNRNAKHNADNMIAATSPSQDFPMGILSLQIHQISDLEYEQINKARDEDDTADDTVAGSDDLPSSYCTVILNHQKIFKTRTKPKSSEPFFNAATERFIRDVSESVDIADVLVAGLQLPPTYLGWDVGTLEILECKSPSDKISPLLHDLRLMARTSVGHGKMYRDETVTEQVCWRGKKGRILRLAVQHRYRYCLIIEFRKKRLGMDTTPAFAVLWLQDIIDELENTIHLPIISGSKANLKRAESNYTYNLKEQLGTMAVTLKFWRGLGPYHQRLASKNVATRDVWEVLNTAMDNKEINNAMMGDVDTAEHSLSSDSSDDQGDIDTLGGLRKQVKTSLKNKAPSNDRGNNDSKADPFKQLQEYNDHSDQLHRRHRGLMQWKGARTAKWMKSKIADSTVQLADSLNHRNQDPGIEKEV
ncbi:MAG: hypothetical protein LQ348_006907 [Seirophora lacunosa]|nr:MAG: hypothetical protein LQ348_006907 [Seirophora lacunosa]